MQSYVIHLIRHGVCKGSQEGRYVGRTDSPLSPEGRKKLEQLRRTGGYPKAQVYFTSPLLRCRQTLAILYPEAKGEIWEDFRECDFGAWEGKTAEEIAAEDSSFASWMEGGAAVSPPGGESSGAFMSRVCQSFEALVTELVKSGKRDAVLVTHGGVIMTILAAYGLPQAGFYDWLTESGSGYSRRIMPDLWMRAQKVEVFAQIPQAEQKENDPEKIVIQLAREAAERAYGTGEQE